MEVPIGTQGVGFDRLDLDDFLDDYIRTHGKRPARERREGEQWRGERKVWGVSSSGGASGLSISESEDAEFARAVERATGKRPKKS